jgi:hypothetical protein
MFKVITGAAIAYTGLCYLGYKQALLRQKKGVAITDDLQVIALGDSVKVKFEAIQNTYKLIKWRTKQLLSKRAQRRQALGQEQEMLSSINLLSLPIPLEAQVWVMDPTKTKLLKEMAESVTIAATQDISLETVVKVITEVSEVACVSSADEMLCSAEVGHHMVHHLGQHSVLHQARRQVTRRLSSLNKWRSHLHSRFSRQCHSLNAQRRHLQSQPELMISRLNSMKTSCWNNLRLILGAALLTSGVITVVLLALRQPRSRGADRPGSKTGRRSRR